MINNFLLNKKSTSGDIYLSPWMFLNWIIIAVCLVIGALLFLSVQADARGVEAQALSGRLEGCLSQAYLDGKNLNENFNIYLECDINPKVMENDNYYFNISLSDSSNQVKYFLVKGSGLFQTHCDYQKGKYEKNFAQCSQRQISVIDKLSGESYIVNIIASSNQK